MALFQIKKQAQDRKPLTLHELVHCNNPYTWAEPPRPSRKRLLTTQKPRNNTKTLLADWIR
jgi:hypothetical protein